MKTNLFNAIVLAFVLAVSPVSAQLDGPTIAVRRIAPVPQAIPGGRLTLQSGQPVPTADQKPNVVVVLTSGTTWAVPANWNNANNTIEVVGAGGGGNNSVGGGGGTAGGGGAYSLISNQTLSGTVGIAVGAGGAAVTAGGDTWLCNANSNCATIGGTAVIVGAKGGGGGVQSGTSAVSGGASASGFGSTKFSGGNSGTAPGNTLCSSGAGGSAGPHGAGGNGGNCSGTTGGAGGTGDNGNVATPGIAATGGTGNEWVKNDNTTITVGAGGGGASGVGGFQGGLYGGGSSGGTNGIAGQVGRNGVIVITYVPLSGSEIWFAPCAGYVAGCGGQFVPIPNGTVMTLAQFTSSPTDTIGLPHILHSTAQAAGSCYDEYIGFNGNTLVLGSGVAWSSCSAGSSSRGTGAGTAQVGEFLGYQVNAVPMVINYDNGNGASSFTCLQNQCLKVGSIIATVAGGVYLQLNLPALYGGGSPIVGLYNDFNRIERDAKVQDQTATWTYQSTTVHDVNASSSNKITWIDGTAGESWEAEYINSFAPTTSSATALTIGMCLNVDCTSNAGFTNAAGSGQILGQGASNNVAIGSQVIAKLSPYPILGLNTITAGEQSSATVSTTQFGEDFMLLKIRLRF